MSVQSDIYTQWNKFFVCRFIHFFRQLPQLIDDFGNSRRFPSAVNLSLCARQAISKDDVLAKRFPAAVQEKLEKWSAAYGRDRVAVSEILGERTTGVVFLRL